MRTRVGSLKVLVVAAFAVVLLASCAKGKAAPADQITLDGFRMNGEVTSTEPDEVFYFFEYLGANASWTATPTRSMYVEVADVGVPVSETVSGLPSGTYYNYRLCAYIEGDDPLCGIGASVGTLHARDEVSGTGYVVDDPVTGLKIGGWVSAFEQGDPEYGYGNVETGPGPSPAPGGAPELYFGQATCLNVQGNRASIGFTGYAAGVSKPLIVFVEDNGPTGDRWGRVEVASEPTTCPVPTAADFPPITVGGTTYPSTLTSGDFTVRDNPGTP